MSVLVWLWVGCGGSAAEGDPVDPGSPDRPALKCGPEASLKRSKDGLEQWCERADGTMHGPYVKYYPDGVTRAETGKYTNGQLDDEWLWWHENGKQEQTGKYTKGKKTGSWTRWHPNGNRSESGDWLQDREAGQWTTWYESGAKREEGLYHNGQKAGVWTVYTDDETGTVLRTEEYRNNALVKINGAPVDAAPAAAAPRAQQ